MISYMFSVIEKQMHWDKIYDILTSKYGKNFEMILLVKKSNPQIANLKDHEKSFSRLKVLEFEDNKSENYMIAHALEQVKGKALILCRDYFDYATIMSDYFVEMLKHNVPIAVYRRPKQKANKVKMFFEKLYAKIVKLIFGYSLYDGDIGLVLFGEIPLSVLKTAINPIILTKVNRWVGFDISYVEKDDLPEPKPEKFTLKKQITTLCIESALLVLSIAGFVILAVFGKLTFLLGLLFIVFFVLFGFLTLHAALKLSIVNYYGDLSVEKETQEEKQTK
ncbi:MAG: hypothetical protein ACOX6H_02700 [Christensenellales bacterium]